LNIRPLKAFFQKPSKSLSKAFKGFFKASKKPFEAPQKAF
jgi:hypothetical protein